MHVTLTEQDDPPEAKSALDGVSACNPPFVGEHGHTPLSPVLRREAGGAPVGGAYGSCYGGWCSVRYLYLPEDLRGGGQGRALIARIKAEAAARGGIGAWLDTSSFQAPGFYEKQGYTRFGTLDDHPPGHARHVLFKRFT